MRRLLPAALAPGPVRPASASPERRGVLQGQDHQPDDRLLGRRRLRPLRPASGALHRQAHPRQPDRRAAEHAGRGLAQGGELHLQAAPKDGTYLRHLRPHHRHQSAAGKRRDLRRHQILLARQRHRRRLDLRDLAHHQGEELGRLPEEAVDARRPGAELGAGHVRAAVQERVRRADQARARLSRHQRDLAGDGARRGRRPVRAVVEHDQDAPRANGSKRRRST